jgi:hypothetical protein
MTSISYLHGSSGETDASRFCREKARDCQRLHLAKLWRELANARSNKREGPENKSVVIFFPKRSHSAGLAGEQA